MADCGVVQGVNSHGQASARVRSNGVRVSPEPAAFAGFVTNNPAGSSCKSVVHNGDLHVTACSSIIVKWAGAKDPSGALMVFEVSLQRFSDAWSSYGDVLTLEPGSQACSEQGLKPK